MQVYAILDKTTNSVLNVVNCNDENSVFLNPDEYFVLANNCVSIGMVYDKNTQTFPESIELQNFTNLRDQIVSIIEVHENELTYPRDLSEQEYISHLNYINNLKSISTLETYFEMKSQFDLIELPPELPPILKIITQDDFRGALKLTEKILWDNPETGTAQQTAAINTFKMEFPYYGVERMSDEFELLEQIGFFTPQRVAEVKQVLS